MKINRAYKTQLHPNNKQETMFRKCAGTARWVFNWALADRIARYERGEKTNKYEQKKRFNSIKPTWLYEVSYSLQDQEFVNVDEAYQNFFRRVKLGQTPGFPKFKSKKRGTTSFTLRYKIRIEHDKIRLPRMGWVKLAERGYLPTEGIKILSVNISERAGKWYASVQVEQEIPNTQPATGDMIGVDLGIKTLAVCSDGTRFENPKALAKYERKLKRLNRELARRKKGSQNRAKTKAKLAKCHKKVADTRGYAIHQVSSYLTKTKSIGTIVIEDLNVAGMVKNRHLARALWDASLGELRRQIEYKSAWRGKQVVIADRFFPSSKMCSVCGAINDGLTLKDRVWICECGAVLDRDLNAALNLAKYATAKQAGVACGVGVFQCATVKQEASHRILEYQSRKRVSVHPI